MRRERLPRIITAHCGGNRYYQGYDLGVKNGYRLIEEWGELRAIPLSCPLR
jgi:hypothetical protein